MTSVAPSGQRQQEVTTVVSEQGRLRLVERQQSAAQGRLAQVRLVLFFTRGMSLEQWAQGGILGREVAGYERLRPHLGAVTFLTYGGEAEERFTQRLGAIAILPNRWRLESNLYSVLAPLLHLRTMRCATVFKTNQLNGAWCAAIAKLMFRKKLIVRSGYLWSVQCARLDQGRLRQWLARTIERAVLRLADRIVVTTESARQHLMKRDHLQPAKIWVIPNYIDTDRFHPIPELAKEPGRVCFVGRLSEEKNLFALLDAMKDLPEARLVLVGDGPLKGAIERKVRTERLPVELLGMVPSDQVPLALNRSRLFILPSRYEGHPKALLEAMACGLPVIGSDAPGIREVIIHRQTGLLCGLSAVAIGSAIRELMADPPLRDRLGAAARAAIISTCSLDRIAEQELALLEDLCLNQQEGDH